MAARRQHPLPVPGSRAFDFRLPRLDGGESALHDLIARGPAVLAFFKVTCPVCQLTLPYLERIHRAGTVPVYGISQNGGEDTTEFTREFCLTLPMLLDREEEGFPASNAFHISSVPTMFVVESDGAISSVMEGWVKRDMELLGERAGAGIFLPGDNVPAWKAG